VFRECRIKELKGVVNDIDIDKFRSKNYMIIGDGVEKLFNEYQYKGYYNFRPPNRSIEKVYIYNKFSNSSKNFSSDTIIMDIDLAKKILGIQKDHSTDIVLTIPNPDELQTIITKIRIAHFDIAFITKEDLYKNYIVTPEKQDNLNI